MSGLYWFASSSSKTNLSLNFETRMKKTIWIFGLIAGLINVAWMLTMLSLNDGCPDFEHGEILGYSAMIVAFSLIFVAVRQIREKHMGGSITFGKAFLIGLYISLIASTLYVVTWLIDYNFFATDFMDQYAKHMLDKARASGATEAELSGQAAEMATFKNMYQNPFVNAAVTYTEILPLGIVVSLICAALLRKKPASSSTV